MTNKDMIRVLIVEDDKETAAYIVKGLTECGHVADHAEDGREGLLMSDSTAVSYTHLTLPTIYSV